MAGESLIKKIKPDSKKMQKCPRCGAENPVGAYRCWRCGYIFVKPKKEFGKED
ncbi:50S ribosomal protein L40e [Candidatus Micrarchaeota archaeon]|nr:50S ribosomal protein L40e [Candidatus Micrarchaeota archaeon]